MNVIHQAAEMNHGGRGVCVALGMFDGVHLGHQEVLSRAIERAKLDGAVPVAITFDQHPSAVVAPDRAPPLLYSLEQRLRYIGARGIQITWLIHFDRAFSLQSGDTFVRALVKDFGRMHSICIGSNFNFGHKRKGNVDLLKTLGEELGFGVYALPALTCDSEVVSSTRIRELVQAGDIAGATRMLGRPYSISGRVIHGERLGQQLGFPTANLDVQGLVLPPNGVYAGHGVHSSRRDLAVMNIGYRPTLDRPTPERRVEVHLLDFSGDLYGANLEFELARRLRGEEKFSSLQALQAQITADIAEARRAPLP